MGINSCESDVDPWYIAKGCINNQSSDSLYILWYDESRRDSLALAPGEFEEFEGNNEFKIGISFDSVMLSNTRQKIVYIPRIDSLEYCIPNSFISKLDKSKSNENLYYYTYNITDSTFQFIADECAKLGQDVWRKK